MANTTHTPGPWEVTPYRYTKHGLQCSRSAIVSVKNGKKSIYITTEITSGPCSDADAHLMAAAPELLECLENILSRLELDEYDDDAPAITKARAALAKAKGADA